jgi:hypothetical protein
MKNIWNDLQDENKGYVVYPKLKIWHLLAFLTVGLTLLWILK